MLAQQTLDALGPEGPIARGLAELGVRHEAREGQLQMADAVARAIEKERVLLCEAGTGTGKTLAYLVPAILSGRRVVISTATKALQEQIYAKDLPLLRAHLAVPFQAALMKGLANYVCLRRLDEALKSEQKAPLARIEQWVRETTSGDRVELEWLRDDDPAWRDVQSGSDTRIGQGCAFNERCFVTRMRDDAQRARVIVVNHHLYLADLALRRGGPVRGKGVIPEHDVVVFDEAHQLEEIATEFFGIRVSSARVEAIARDARRTLRANAGREPADASVRVDTVSDAAKALFGALALHAPPGEARAPFPENRWSDELVELRGRLDAALEALARSTSRAKEEEHAVISRRATSLRDDLARVSSPGRDDVPWIEVRQRSCAIGISPIDLAPVFRDELFAGDRQWPRTVVLTSATLATDDGFAYAKRRLGVDRGAEELIVASPFDFRKNAGVYVPLDLPEPNDGAFVDRAATRVIELIRASRGGAFVLCASNKNMRAFHALLKDAELPWPILCQGERPKFSLLAEFRERGDAILVATMGFWEGVDVPGRALRLVVIDKLPFAVPSDPVVAARHRAIEEEGRSSFAELSVPEAAISLKQGFGRLIRTGDDAGVVAILDKRLRTRGYGKTMRASLPPASPLFDLEQVRAFFEICVG